MTTLPSAVFLAESPTPYPIQNISLLGEVLTCRCQTSAQNPIRRRCLQTHVSQTIALHGVGGRTLDEEGRFSRGVVNEALRACLQYLNYRKTLRLFYSTVYDRTVKHEHCSTKRTFSWKAETLGPTRF